MKKMILSVALVLILGSVAEACHRGSRRSSSANQVVTVVAPAQAPKPQPKASTVAAPVVLTSGGCVSGNCKSPSRLRLFR